MGKQREGDREAGKANTQITVVGNEDSILPDLLRRI